MPFGSTAADQFDLLGRRCGSGRDFIGNHQVESHGSSLAPFRRKIWKNSLLWGQSANFRAEDLTVNAGLFCHTRKLATAPEKRLEHSLCS